MASISFSAENSIYRGTYLPKQLHKKNGTKVTPQLMINPIPDRAGEINWCEVKCDIAQILCLAGCGGVATPPVVATLGVLTGAAIVGCTYLCNWLADKCREGCPKT